MPLVALLDNAATDVAPSGASTPANHAWEMQARFAASQPGTGWTMQLYHTGPTSAGIPAALAAALADGCRIVVAPFPTYTVPSAAVQAAENAGALIVGAVSNDPYPTWSAPAQRGLVAVSVGDGHGNPITGWGPGVVACIETHDAEPRAQSWATAAMVAILTRYPEATTDPLAALARVLAGAEGVGGERWTAREGFGVVRTLHHALVGLPIRTGDQPTSNSLYGPGGAATAMPGGFRYTRTSTHPFLVAYRSMPAPGAGLGARWTFEATNHHATEAVRFRSQTGGGHLVLAPSASGTFTMEHVAGGGAAFFIETCIGIGGQIDVTVTNLVQDVYEHVTSLPDLAPEGGALSPILSVTQEGAPGRYRARLIRLGTAGASLRVDGVERLQTSSDTALLYLPAGSTVVEARGVLAGGGLTEAHTPGTAAVTVAQGYIPPAPSVEVERAGGKLLVSAEAEGATGYVVTAQAGDDAPTLVEGGEATWPPHLPARVVASAVGAGGTSSATTTRVPAVRSTAPLVEEGLHPRLTLV